MPELQLLCEHCQHLVPEGELGHCMFCTRTCCEECGAIEDNLCAEEVR